MRNLQPIQRSLVTLPALLVLSTLLLPIVYALWISFTPKEILEVPTEAWSIRWYREFFSRPQWIAGIYNSLFIGAIATVLSVISGTCTAIAVTDYYFRGRRFLQAAVVLPLFIPSLILGMSLLPVMRLLGLWGSHLSVAAAHSLLGLPLVFLVVKSSIADQNPHLISAARGLGANPWQVRKFVTFPLIAPAVATGALMSMIISINELVMSLFLCTADTETLPKVIWPNLRYTLSPLIAAASSVIMISTLLLLFIVWQLRKCFSAKS